MLQLRLWLTVVVIVLAGGLVLLLGTSALHERVMLPFEQVQTQATAALNGALTKHGGEVVEAAARASVDEAVRAAAIKGEMDPAADAALLGRAGNHGAPAFALLVKPDGVVAARAGGEVKLEGPLTGFPLFVEASTGVARDGLHFIDGKPFHLASAPIYDAGALVAVALLGWPYDDAFVERLSQQVGAPVVLLTKDGRIGTALADLTPEQLRAHGTSVGALSRGTIPKQLPILIPDSGRYLLGTVPVFGAGESLSMVVGIDRNAAFMAVATAQGLVIIGTLLIAFLQMMLILTTLRAVNKPIEVIVDHLSQVSQGNSVGILPEAALSGQFLRLGKQVNMILQMMPSTGRPGAPLGTLGGSLGGSGTLPHNPNNTGSFSIPVLTSPGLGAPAPALPEPEFQGIPGVGAPVPPRPISPPPSSPAAIGDINLGPSTASGPMPAAPAEPPSSGLSSLFDDSAADPLAAFRVQPKPPSSPPQPVPPAQPAPPASMPSMPSMPPMPVTATGNGAPAKPEPMSPEATVMFQVPQELLNQAAQKAAAHAPPPAAPPTPSFRAPPPSSHTDDARTVVAQVPQELLSSVAAAAREHINNADEAHYREVYDKFVQTRVECGEDTSDLTYDRFVAKLLKNRQQIVEKHKAKSVRFQVYVKEGKAALRALPVRE